MAEPGEGPPISQPDIPTSDGNNLHMRTERPLETGQNPITHSEQGEVDHALAEAREKMIGGNREIKPISGGAGFLFERPEDLEDVKNEELRSVVGRAETMFATATGRVAADGLAKVYGRISDMVLDGRVEPEEAQDFLGRINQRVEALDLASTAIPNQIAEQIGQRVGEAVQAGTRATEQLGREVATALRQTNEESRNVREREARLHEQIMTTALEDQREFMRNLRISDDLEAAARAYATTAQPPQPGINELAELIGRTNPERERERWIQQEYNQDFYARFQPNQEPHFYSNLEPVERELFDARWQLARAAFIKKIQSGNPKELVGNQELVNLKSEQMERLYNMPGVRLALEWYVRFITKNETIRLPVALVRPGRERITIWQCQNKSEFEAIRKQMRADALGDLEQGSVVKFGSNGGEPLSRYEADAVAWNIIWCSNLVESSDSRYTTSGGREGNLPGFLVSDDLRATFHTQEKFEDKCASDQDWGVFGKWGLTQLRRIKREVGFDSDPTRKDEIKFAPVTRISEFWKSKIADTGRTNRNGLKIREITVNAPECYPTTTYASFLERWGDGGDNGSKFIDKLLNKEQINWKAVPSDAWLIYQVVGLNKTVKLFEFFHPGVPLDLNKPGAMKEWAREVLDSITRLKLEKSLSRKEIHNLKVWAIYGGLGGMTKPDGRKPSSPVGSWDKGNFETMLRTPYINYLQRGSFGALTGEGLNIEE